jgi:hypothetical protein
MLINEYTLGDLQNKQQDITKLFPTFYDRVAKVEEKGGVRLLQKYPSLLHFKIHSGTKQKVWYDGYIKFKNIKQFLAEAVQDKENWNARGNRVVLRKVAEKLIEQGDLQILCSCPSQQFYGFNYILSRPDRDAKYGKAENRPPVVRNSGEVGAFCKHNTLLLNELPDYTITLARWIGKAYKDTMQKMVDNIKSGRKKFKVMESREQKISPLEPEEIERIEKEEEPIITGDEETFEEAPTEPTEEPVEEEDKNESLTFQDLFALNEEGEAVADTATTEDDIAYLPGGFKKVISKIKKKKDKGRIKVLETVDGVRIYENDSLFIHVPNVYVSDFAESLNEELSKTENSVDMDKLRKKAKKAILESFKKKPFKTVVDRYLFWKKIFPKSKVVTPDSVAVPVPHFQDRAVQLTDAAVKANWDDRGALDQIIKATLSGQSVAQFEPFGNFDYLYGVVVRSLYGKVLLEYSILVSPDLNIREQIKVDEESILDDIKDPSIVISGKNITPNFKSGLLNKRTLLSLKYAIDDIE